MTLIEVAFMIDTISIVTKEAVINMFTNDLSVYLAEYLLKVRRSIQLIKQVLHKKYKAYQPHNAIEALVVGSYVEVVEKRSL